MIGRRCATLRHIVLVSVLCLQLISPARAEHDSLPPDYPESLERDLAFVLSRLASQGEDLPTLLQGAELYMRIADDLFADEEKKRLAYEAGAEMARRAVHLDPRQAHAHFLYAANRGSAERMKGLTSAGFVLGEIRNHLRQALAINPTHPQALQMMGGLYAELPWVFGGSEKEAESYLRRAIEADGQYTHAHLILARLYIKQHRFAEARTHIRAVIEAKHPHYPYAWTHLFKPEAERLLKTLPPS